MTFSSRAVAIFSSRRLAWLLVVPAVLLAAPALGTGLVVDDYVLRAAVTGKAPALSGARELDAFRFAEAGNVPGLIADGILPWWASPGLRLAFARPLASASHWLDFRLFPGSAVAMHAVSLAWLAAAVVMAAMLYRRLFPEGWVAGLAATLFAFDPGHTLAAGWISARNALLAGFFGLAAVYAHDRWRRDGERAAALPAALLTAASLASGEAGVGTLGLLAAHAFAFEGPGLRGRVRALLPHVGVALVWVALYRARGYGTAHSAMYADPIASPADFLRFAVLTLPVNVGAKLGGPPASLVVLGAARLAVVLAGLGLAFTACTAAATWPFLRRDPVARFLAAAVVLAALPIAGTIPNDRNLLLVGFAGFGLHALVVRRAVEERGLPLRLLAGWLLLIDLVIAVPAGLANARSMDNFTRLSRDALARVLLDDAVRGQTVVFVNPPSQFLTSHLGLMRDGTALPVPVRMRSLVPGIYPSRITRTRDDQLAVHVEGGILPPPGTWPAIPGPAPAFRWEYIGQLLGSYARGLTERVPAGEVVSLPGCRIEVVAVAGAGGPSDMLFTFDRSLDDPSLRWLAFRDRGYEPFAVPPVGQAVELPPASMGP